MSEYQAVRMLIKLAELKKAQAEVAKLEAELNLVLAKSAKKGSK